jgi:phospholipase/carboxylesterase
LHDDFRPRHGLAAIELLYHRNIQGSIMNRLHSSGKSFSLSAPQSVQVDRARLTSSERLGVPHALFAPLHYEPNYAYPLLVWLHGPNDDERQLQRIMPLLSMRNYVAVGPRGNVQALNGRSGFGWKDSPSNVATAEQLVFGAIEVAQTRFHIASHRIFLAGLELGGTLAYRIVAQYPERFAGVLSIGGAFPAGGQPLACVSKLRRVPLFVAQGRDSEVYPVDRLCTDLRLMHSAGLSITLRQYPCSDELNTQMLHDMDAWMMEIVTGQPTLPRPPVVEPADLN